MSYHFGTGKSGDLISNIQFANIEMKLTYEKP